MNISSFGQYIQGFYNVLLRKEPRLQLLSDKLQGNLKIDIIVLTGVLSSLSYILSNQYSYEFFPIVAISLLLIVLRYKKHYFLIKLFCLAVTISLPWFRKFYKGPEISLFNQFSVSFSPFTVMLFTESYLITVLCSMHSYFFCLVNSKDMLEDYGTYVNDFHQPLRYLLSKYNSINIFVFCIVSFISYQRQSLLKKVLIQQEENEKLLKEMEKKTGELEKHNRERSKFLLGLSHEFRNPINAALGNIELADGKSTDDSVKKYLTNCKTSIEMLFHLVSNVLDSTKLEDGILEWNPGPKNSRTMLLKVWDIVKNLFDKQDLIGEFYIHKNIPKTIVMDSHFFIKVLLNLILNSIKYTNEGGVMVVVSWIAGDHDIEALLYPSEPFSSRFWSAYPGKKRASANNTTINLTSPVQSNDPNPANLNPDTDVPYENAFGLSQCLMEHTFTNRPLMSLTESFQNASNQYDKLTNKQDHKSLSMNNTLDQEQGPSRKKGFIKVEVYDSGCGIESELLKHCIFKKHASTQVSTEDRLGLGLGLWLTKNLCESKGGRIKALSEKDKGSLFTVVIPLESTHSPQILADTRSINAMTLQPKTKLTALVVDDDRYNREISTIFLGKAGVIVKEEATNGLEAVKIFTSKPSNYFDFIVMDLEMPVMNGKEAIRKIRQFEKNNKRPPAKIVVATGNCNLEEYSVCMNPAGDIRANLFYRKPLTKKDFEEFVEVIRKDKPQGDICMAIKGDPMMNEILENFLKTKEISFLCANSIAEAKEFCMEFKSRLKWIFLSPKVVEDDIQAIVQLKSVLETEMARVEIFGLNDFLIDRNRHHYQNYGIRKILDYPLTNEVLKEIFEQK